MCFEMTNDYQNKEEGKKMNGKIRVIKKLLPAAPYSLGRKTAGSKDPIWRYSKNPIIPRDLIPSSNSIFNSAVVPFKDKFAGVFRCDTKTRIHNYIWVSAITALTGSYPMNESIGKPAKKTIRRS
jgi:hypothetical protein